MIYLPNGIEQVNDRDNIQTQVVKLKFQALNYIPCWIPRWTVKSTSTVVAIDSGHTIGFHLIIDLQVS